MTYKQWEQSLLNYLKSLKEEEKNEIVGYYREIYNDKLDLGIAESDIVKAFGDPMLAAAKILKEGDGEPLDDEYAGTDHKVPHKSKADGNDDRPKAKVAPPVLNKAKEKVKSATSNITVSKVVGWFFITVLILIPLASVLIGVVATLFALTISGGAMIIGGLVGAVASVFTVFLGYEIGGILFLIGSCLATAGIGAILFVIFYYLTKYSVFSCIKACKYLVRRDK